MPIILATQEVEVRRIIAQHQPSKDPISTNKSYMHLSSRYMGIITRTTGVQAAWA
jgi:hypothetical protein